MRKLIALFCMITPLFTLAQAGGDHTYQFLDLTPAPRLAALGSNILSVQDNDINLALVNPSLINPEMDNHLSLSFIDYYSDINFGFATYSKTFEKYGSFAATMQFASYGKFDRADMNGNNLGSFKAGEYALNLGWGRALDSSFSIGANLKGILSNLDTYNSFGLAVDVVGTYQHRPSQFSASLAIRNAGRQITSYTPGNNEPLPFQIQLAISKRLEHVPLRFHLIAEHLQQWDLTFEDPYNPEPTIDPLTGEALPEKKLEKFADKLMRHAVIGAEFVPGKNISLWLGYNYRRRQEMKVDTKLSMVGFSWGVGIRIAKIQFAYARSANHLAGSPNYISVSTDLSRFKSRKKS